MINATTDIPVRYRRSILAAVLVALISMAPLRPVLAVAEPFIVLRMSTPLIASVGGGLWFGDYDGAPRPTIQAEAGIGGGKIALGLDSTGKGKAGYGLKAAFIRTWIESLQVDEGQRFMGLEGEFSIQKLIFNLGGYIGIDNDEDDWMFSAGVGFVF
jgi:hypothetical protein